MKIRPAKAKNVDTIAALWHSGWHQAHAAVVPEALTALRTADEFAARTEKHRKQTQVAWIGDEPAGFFMIDGDELYQFYVARPFQGGDTAANLMQAAEAELGEGLKWLACSVGNDRAARFYEKSGWVKAGEIPYEVETGEGPLEVRVWRFEKRLGDPL